MLTFNREKALIWPSAWSLTKVLFLLTRYSPFIDVTIVIWRKWAGMTVYRLELLKPQMTPHDCKFVYESTGCSYNYQSLSYYQLIILRVVGLLLSGILIAEG